MRIYTVKSSTHIVYQGVSHKQSLDILEACKKDPSRKCQTCPYRYFDFDENCDLDASIHEAYVDAACPDATFVKDGDIDEGFQNYKCTGAENPEMPARQVTIEFYDTDK